MVITVSIGFIVLVIFGIFVLRFLYTIDWRLKSILNLMLDDVIEKEDEKEKE